MAIFSDEEIETLRHPHESDKEWGLRKQFILAHRDKSFTVDRLLCLASCFINVECYGTSYPAPVMHQLKELCVDIQEDVDNHRKQMLERNTLQFVKAGGCSSSSQAPPNCEEQASINLAQTLTEVELKFVCLAHHLKEIRTKKDKLDKNAIEILHLASDQAKLAPEFTTSRLADMSGLWNCELRFDFVLVSQHKARNKKDGKRLTYEAACENLLMPYFQVLDEGKPNAELKVAKEQFANCLDVQLVWERRSEVKELSPPIKPVTLVTHTGPTSKGRSVGNLKRPRSEIDTPLGNFLLIEPLQKNNSVNAMCILHQSAAFNKVPLKFDFREHTGVTRCQVLLGDHVMTDIVDCGKVAAKAKAAEKVVKQLRQTQWTIQTKKQNDSEEPEVTKNELAISNTASQDTTIKDTNVGHKLLEKMGWSGGGIGATGNKGIAEPIQVEQVIHRKGLGADSESGVGEDFTKIIKNALHHYASTGSEKDLVFSPEFTKEERVIIHQHCKRLGLKTHSHGTHSDRYLVVSRKRDAQALFRYVMENGGETSKYIAIPPGSLAK